MADPTANLLVFAPSGAGTTMLLDQLEAALTEPTACALHGVTRANPVIASLWSVRARLGCSP